MTRPGPGVRGYSNPTVRPTVLERSPWAHATEIAPPVGSWIASRTGVGGEGFEQLFGGVGDQVGESLGPRAIGDGEILVGSTEQDDGATFMSGPGALGGQGGLSRVGPVPYHSR
jgi:hypothetical protein